MNMVSNMKEYKYLLVKRDGKRTKYLITSDGRDYISRYSEDIDDVPAEEVKSFSFKEYTDSNNHYCMFDFYSLGRLYL